MSKKNSKSKAKIQNSSSLLPDDTQLKEETLRWIFAIACTTVLYAFIGYVITRNYHPDIQSLLDSITKISFTGSPRPEPVESLLVKAGMIFVPILLFVFYFLFTKTKVVNTIASKSSFNYITTFIVLILVVLIYKDFSAPNPFSPSTGAQAENLRDVECATNFEFFFKGLFLGKHLLLYTFIIVPLICGIFLVGLKKYKWEDKPAYNFFFLVPGNLFLGGVILSIVIMNIYYFPYTYENKYDFNAVYYSMTQVYAGSPMLVDGFTNTYGLYPHFFNLIFKIIGLNIFNFTAVLSILLALSFTLNFFFLKRYISNKIILYLGILSIIYFPYLSHNFLLLNFDSTFSFFPIRYIIPSALFFLTGWYLNKKSKVIYWLTSIMMGVFVLWNPEIGLVCYLSWVFINVYYDFYDDQKRINIQKILFHLIVGFALLLVIFNIYKLIIYINYGSAPEMNSLFTYMFLFGNSGFGALPMTLIHPWNIIVIVYMISFLYPIVKFLQKDITPKAVIILLVSILGFGFFLYFQGRSHNFQLLNASVTCFVLLALIGDMLWKKVKTRNVPVINLLFIIFIYIISFSFFEIATKTKKINELFYQKDDKAKNREEENRIKSNEQFVLNNTKPHEKIYMFTAWHHQGLYFNGNERRSAFNPSLLEMVLYSDLKRLEKNLIDSSFNVFFEPELCKYNFLSRPIAVLSAKYEVYSGNLSMGLLKPIKNKIPATVFFKPDNTTVLHSKYTSDSIGIRARVNDGEGIKILTLQKEFSVELLFRPQQQIYQYATLIANMTDSSGFMIANEKGSDKYYFGINGRSFVLPLINKGWVYCVMDVFPNKIEIYQNGNLTQTLPLQEPYKNSVLKTYIGNIGFLRNYFGQIAEVSVSQRTLSNQEVHDKWLLIENECKQLKQEE